MIRAGQAHGFFRFAALGLQLARAQRHDGHVQLIEHLALLIVSDHAFNPEEAANALAARDWVNTVHRGGRIEQQAARWQLVGEFAAWAADDQLAAFVAGGITEEDGAGQIGAQKAVVSGHVAQRVVDMLAEGVGLTAIAVEIGRVHAARQGGGHEVRAFADRRDDQIASLRRDATPFRGLLVVFDLRGLLARSGQTADPAFPLGRMSNEIEHFANVLRGEDAVKRELHGGGFAGRVDGGGLEPGCHVNLNNAPCAGNVVAPVERIGIVFVGQVVDVGLDGVGVADAVFGQ